jgi:molybdate transport system ATP-binding protein
VNQLSFRCRHAHRGGFQLDAAFETDARVTALVGPSGSGKTTVLSLIAGLYLPDSGCIRLGDRTLVDTAKEQFVPVERRRVGLVFQDQLLFPHLSVRANLGYGERRRPRASQAIEFGRVVEVLELGDLLERFPRNLSGGERQRVALGRSLLASPELLLLDEPLAALDQALKDRILTYLERVIGEWQIPVVYVSHGMAEVTRLAEWVVVIESGRVLLSGRASAVLRK